MLRLHPLCTLMPIMPTHTHYICNICGAETTKWSGQCPDCNAWNSLVEYQSSSAPHRKNKSKGYAGTTQTDIQTLSAVECTHIQRLSTSMPEFDRVLGGGIVPGSVVLIGGDPGVGKSSLLLQVLAQMSQQQAVLYVSGEESANQVALRAQRMGVTNDQLKLLTETQVESIIAGAQKCQPKVMVIDSIQTMYVADITSAPGGVAQVRESAAALTQFAKQHHIAVLLVGHVTKTGEVAGPRVLEHIVDAVLYLEGQNDGRFRILRGIKNRFGAVNELGVFAMTDKGMREVSNPSAIFLSSEVPDAAGSTVMIAWEGTRPLLVELQALVDQSYLPNPRRVTVGIEQNRLVMLLAVLHRHASISTYDQDVFVNAVGGIRISETASDLAILTAIVSSLKNAIVPRDTAIFGEVGLSGEVRPVPNGTERVSEAIKHGFKRIIAPSKNLPGQRQQGIEYIGVKTLSAALTALF